jgi:predicted DsbA family dithiol-disulfide isomerase
MHIDIWSDVVCPWCYLGVHRFEQALDELGLRPAAPDGADGADGADGSDSPDGPVVRFHAYQLDPHAPIEPQPLRPTLERKYGAGAFDAMTERLTRLGDDAGIDYRFDRTQRVNTHDAHRLLAWASATSPGRVMALERALFVAYFTDGRNVADLDTLVAVAAATGLDPDEARTALLSDAFVADVRSDQDRALDLGITGVPAFVIDDGFVIPGAQEVDTFVRILTTRLDRSA